MSSTLANHYIRPEDLSPLPTTLDAKKSPLALLAQTCSNIGADLLPNNKPIIPPLEKTLSSKHGQRTNSDRSDSVSSEKNSLADSNRSSSTGSGETRIPFKPYETSKTSNSGGKSDTTVNNSSNNANSNKTESSKNDTSKNNRDNNTSNNTNSNKSLNCNGCISDRPSPPSHHHHHLNVDSVNNKSTVFKPYETTKRPESRGKSPAANNNSNTNNNNNHSNSNANNKALNCNGCLPHHPTHSSQHHHPSHHPHLAVDSVNKFVPYPSLSPYLSLSSYDAAAAAAAAARLNPAGGASGHCHSPNTMCRDPFCASCRFKAAAVALGGGGGGGGGGPVVSCPAGCTQCSHTSSIASSISSHMGLAAALSQHGSYLSGNGLYQPPPIPVSSSSSSSSSGSSANGGLNKPNICSWVVGNNFCGKRFRTTEELHQHLRNHTLSDPSSVSALAFLGQYPHLAPMLTSPIAGLRRTAFDPVNRYHPYKPSYTNPGANGGAGNFAMNGGNGGFVIGGPGGISVFTSLPSGLTNIPSLTSHSAASQLNMHYQAYGPYGGRLGPPIPP